MGYISSSLYMFKLPQMLLLVYSYIEAISRLPLIYHPNSILSWNSTHLCASSRCALASRCFLVYQHSIPCKKAGRPVFLQCHFSWNGTWRSHNTSLCPSYTDSNCNYQLIPCVFCSRISKFITLLHQVSN